MMKLNPGDRAPDFSLPDQDGKEVSLASLKGKWIILYFYPKDNTPGCTLEGKEFTEIRQDVENLGGVMLGVSPDSQESHCKFRDKHGLGVTLLSDVDRNVMDAYGAWKLKKNYGREYLGVVRSTFLIDPKGRLARVWSNVKARGHAARVLDVLKEATS